MKLLIVANWKCNPTTLAEAKRLFNSIKSKIDVTSSFLVTLVICPPFVYLSELAEILKRDKKKQKIKLGAQDCFWEQSGAYTGEISPQMLKNLGVEYVIIGHSERRRYQKETDEMISKKLKAAISAKLKPILCIGETEKERKQGKTFKILREQLKKDLKGLINSSTHQLINLIIAYEPVWAIGTGNSCEPEDAKEVLVFLQKFLRENLILYGGSVNSKNGASYIKDSNPPTTLPSKGRAPAGFQGLLVGGASLNAQEFIKIVKSVAK